MKSIKNREVIIMNEERDDMVVVLVDDEGVETEYEHLDTIEMNGKEYVVLMPIPELRDDEDEDEDEEENWLEEDEDDEVFIFRVMRNENGEDTLVSVEDEDELDAVFEEFRQRNEDEYDFEDLDEEE